MITNISQSNNYKPKYVIQIGEFHGVLCLYYTSYQKHYSSFNLTLFRGHKQELSFFAETNYDQTHEIIESSFGYRDETVPKPIEFIHDTPFYEVSNKFSSYMPIKLDTFIELVKKTLSKVFNVTDEFIYYQITNEHLKEYYNKHDNELQKYINMFLDEYFYVSKSIFNCIAKKSEELIIDDCYFHEIPPILLTCTWVKKLEFANTLISVIPEEMTKLHNLESLSFRLKLLKELPRSIDKLQNLEVLKIIETEINKLPENLFRLKNLKELHLANNKLEALPTEITALPKLKILNVQGNQLKKIPENLFKMESIEEINLSNNPLLNPNEINDFLLKSGRSDKINLTL